MYIRRPFMNKSEYLCGKEVYVSLDYEYPVSQLL